MIVTLTGRVPSKKNSKRRIKRGAKIFMVPSAAHEAWHLDASMQLKNARVNRNALPIAKIEKVTIEFTAADRRSADLSNKAESIMDLLVDCGWIHDDNWFVVPRLELILAGVNPGNPNTKITIKLSK